jgi:hypothetical protein
MSIAAATDGAVFHAHLEQVRLPGLRRVKPDALDRAAIKGHGQSQRPQDRSGARCPMARASPAAIARPTRRTSWGAALPTPIELAWAKVKGLWRKAAAWTVDGLHAARAPTLDAINPQDAQAFFRHAGHACPIQPALRAVSWVVV